MGIEGQENQPLIGRIIAGKLRIIELLGSGSMGRVYRARHMSLDKDVAIKVLRDSASTDPSRAERFAREARAASRLNHPNSVAILDFGEDGADGLLYIAMELLDGEDLQTVIDRGSLTIHRICHIMIQALAALAAAHDAGIIHRDVKPSNIVLVKQKNDEGLMTEVVKVCDFGVAKINGGKSDTHDGGKGAPRVIGTPLYMSPEQALGDALDPRTDVYSCGVLMYELLTGQPPFSAETPMGVLMKHVSEPVVLPSALVPDLAVEFEALIRWSLEKNRMLRPSTARELRNALRAFLAGKAGTIPALARYGVHQIEDEEPWTGPTPYYQLDLPAPPRAKENVVLPAPPLPIPQPKLPNRSSPEHIELVADLNLQIEHKELNRPRAETTYKKLRVSNAISSELQRTAPPRGAHVPLALRGSLDDDGGAEIFSEHSYFHVRRQAQKLVSIDDEVQLDAPPPRTLKRGDESNPEELGTPKPKNQAHYLWNRFGISPDRVPPKVGLWVRDSEGQELGPLTWSELTHVLRMEASDGNPEDSSISADRKSWIAASRFVRLAGIEAILQGNDSLPHTARFQGHLSHRSVASLFAAISHRSTTGRLMLRVEDNKQSARFDIHVDEGRPTFVFTNEPHLQLPNLLIVKGILAEDKLPQYIGTVLRTAKTLEEAVRNHVQFDVAEYRGAVMKERLRHLLGWRNGRFAFDESAQPASRRPFAPSLLALLPDLVYRTLSTEELEQELKRIQGQPFTRAPEASERLQEMGLTRSQRGVAERILAAADLSEVIPSNGRVRKAYTTMAYVLREMGLIEPVDDTETPSRPRSVLLRSQAKTLE